MYTSKDGLIHVEFVNSIEDATFAPSDWSVINTPPDMTAAASTFERLYNTPTSRHVCLALTRHRRKDRIKSIESIGRANQFFTYLDTVSIWYEKPSSCSNNGLLPIAESGYLFYKGQSAPDTKRTKWFSDDYGNATNLWDLTSQDQEGDKTYYQVFSWEMNMLMMSLCGTMEHRRFVYAVPLGSNEYDRLFGFCKRFNVAVSIYTDDETQIAEMAAAYQKFSKEQK